MSHMQYHTLKLLAEFKSSLYFSKHSNHSYFATCTGTSAMWGSIGLSLCCPLFVLVLLHVVLSLHMPSYALLGWWTLCLKNNI